MDGDTLPYVTWIRKRVGRRKVILVYSTVIARDGDGRVLLQRRADLPVWGFPGGVLEFGEDIETCARRELREETGLEVGTLVLVGLYSSPRYDVAYPNGDQAQQFTICLTGLVNGGRFAADGEESLEQRFFAPADAPLAEMPVWYRDMLADLDRAAGPAFDAAVPTLEGAPDMTDLLGGQSGLIVPVVWVAAVGPDGRLLVIPGADGVSLPSTRVRLGETAAAAAQRALAGAGGLAAEPSRLLGVLSAPEAGSPAGQGSQQVAAVLRTDVSDMTNAALARWVTPEALLAESAPQLLEAHRWILAHLNGGYFIH